MPAPVIRTTDYQSHAYNYLSRWVSYFTQVDEVLKFKPRSVLEVGVGDGVVRDYFAKRGLTVTAVDIDPVLKPDIICSVTKITLPENAVDVALCAEVLEHIPFEDVPQALSELRRVAKDGVVISVPHWGPTLHFVFRLPLFKRMEFFQKLRFPWKKHRQGGEHYWELGKADTPVSRFITELHGAGLVLVRDFISPESPYHHFFICRVA